MEEVLLSTEHHGGGLGVHLGTGMGEIKGRRGAFLLGHFFSWTESKNIEWPFSGAIHSSTSVSLIISSSFFGLRMFMLQAIG